MIEIGEASQNKKKSDVKGMENFSFHLIRLWRMKWNDLIVYSKRNVYLDAADQWGRGDCIGKMGTAKEMVRLRSYLGDT